MKMRTHLQRTVYSMFVVLLLAATASAQNASSLSDAEVAFIAVTANQIDINYAQIAKQKSKDVEVIRFAETMERDHKAVIGQAVALAKKLGVTPQDNAVSKQMLTNADKMAETLRSKSGKAFDQAYIANEVTYHKSVIEAVETILIPETENAALKQLLQNILPALKAHLAHAEMLQKNVH